MSTTVSTVLISTLDQEHDAMLRRHCEEVVKRGGTYAVETKYVTCWMRVYTINWPESHNKEAQ